MRQILGKALRLAPAGALLLVLGGVLFNVSAVAGRHVSASRSAAGRTHAALFAEGQQVFRYDTFGDQRFWTGALHLEKTIEGRRLGGLGPGLSPKAALAAGLKVDASALPASLVRAIKAGKVNLNSPATTLALLKLNSVVGVQADFKANGTLNSVGITCALCHSTVNDSFAPGIGQRLDGWANQDLNVGAVISLAPNLQPFANLLGTDVATVRKVFAGWGPGKFDAELTLDGKGFAPDGHSGAVLIPPALGLAGVNLAIWTGFGQMTYWNAFVANLDMHGIGNFLDQRLDDPNQFPVAARNGLGHVHHAIDLITPVLGALQTYQLGLPVPRPPATSFNHVAAARGRVIFDGVGKCASCHVSPTFSAPGYNVVSPAAICTDSFEADRSPTHGYRISPLRALFAHAKRGFYHDGRYPTLLAVVDHYDSCFGLHLTAKQKADLVQYLKSL